jgi:cob(I)alamin adenosyltransferase
MENEVKMNDQVLDTALESAENLLRVSEVLSSKANSISVDWKQLTDRLYDLCSRLSNAKENKGKITEAEQSYIDYLQKYVEQEYNRLINS